MGEAQKAAEEARLKAEEEAQKAAEEARLKAEEEAQKAAEEARLKAEEEAQKAEEEARLKESTPESEEEQGGIKALKEKLLEDMSDDEKEKSSSPELVGNGVTSSEIEVIGTI